MQQIQHTDSGRVKLSFRLLILVNVDPVNRWKVYIASEPTRRAPLAKPQVNGVKVSAAQAEKPRSRIAGVSLRA